MTLHTVGEVSLSLSTSIYLIWLLPQLLHNYKRKSTVGLSFCFHSFLLLGYEFDLLYGFGLHMQWQYRLVTMVGLCSLFVQHIQFGRYNTHHFPIKIQYISVSIAALLLMSFSIYTLIFIQHAPAFYNFSGVISNSCHLAYLLPQMRCNYKNKSTQGLSSYFLFLSITLAALDLISAYALQWNWPSIAGPVFGLIFKLFLLYQIYLYSSMKEGVGTHKDGVMT